MTVKVRPYRRGGWEVDIRLRLPDGTLHRERCKSPVSSKTGSMRWGQDRERHLLTHGVPEEPKERVPTLEEFSIRYMEEQRGQRRAPATLSRLEAQLRLHLIPLLGDVALDRIGEAHVSKLRSERNHLKASSINTLAGHLWHMLRLAARWGVIPGAPPPPAKLRETSSEIEWYRPEELPLLIEAAKAHSAEAHLLVLLGAEAGLRRGEIIALEWSDLDLKRGMITVARSDWQGEIGPTKSGKTRQVPMTSRLRDALRAHRHLVGPRVLYHQGKCGPVPMTATVIWRTLLRLHEGLGWPHRGPHTLRHTYASTLALRGAPVRAIQELCGHSSIRVTEKYMHLAPGALHAAVALLERGDTVETGS